MAEPVNLDPLSADRMRRRREHLMDEITATPTRHPLVRRPLMMAAAALSALAVAAGGIAVAATRGGGEPNPDADLRGGALETCDATWSCLHPAALAASDSLLAPKGAVPEPQGAGVYYYDAKGSFVMNLVFHPAALPRSTATYIATRGPRRPLSKPTGGTPMTVRGTTAILQQWPGGGSLNWSQDGWSYKLAIGDTRTNPLPAPQVITVLTTQATQLTPVS